MKRATEVSLKAILRLEVVGCLLQSFLIESKLITSTSSRTGDPLLPPLPSALIERPDCMLRWEKGEGDIIKRRRRKEACLPA